MKKILLAILLVLVFCSTGIASIKDSPDGFRGIKWGQSPAALGKNAIGLPIEGLISGYFRRDENLKIGGANIEYIGYAFWENKFLHVTIVAKGAMNGEALKAAMIERYGEQYDLDADGEYLWYDDNVLIKYTYDTRESEATASISGRRLMQAMADRQKSEAQKGAKDF